jgi:uncharacterized protein (TIGR03067 family)
MSSNVSHGIVVQFFVQGFGSDDDFQRRLAIEELVGRTLEADGNGESTGGDGGSGTMNAFFSVNDPTKARERVLEALRDAGELDEGTVVVHQVFREDEDGAEEGPDEEIWWPADYAFGFSSFGPMWKGAPDKAALDGVSEGLRSLQGQWGVVRYDAPDGTDGSAAMSELSFMIARDQLVVQREVAVISAARLRVDAPGEVDLRPLMGPNQGAVSTGRYELRGEELHFCMVPPNQPRPAAVAPNGEHQPGRMILQRQA